MSQRFHLKVLRYSQSSLVLVSKLVLVLAFFSAISSESQAFQRKRITLIALADFHGALEANQFKTANGRIVHSGGAALLSSYIEAIRQHSAHPVLLLDGGDLFQGTLVSNQAEGAPVIKFYNHLAVDAAAVGNHEFDYGPVGPNSVPKNPQEDPRGALRQRSSQASFPFLAANIYHADGSRPDWLKPSVLIKKSGIKIGIIGAATESTPSTTVARNLVGLSFPDPAPSIIAEAQSLRQRGADLVLLTIHEGGSCNDNSAALSKDLSSCDPNYALFKLLQRIPSGLIDAVVGGHSHKGVAKKVNGIVVLQPFSHGQTLMWSEISEAPDESLIHPPQRVCGHTVPSKQGPTCERAAVEAFNGEPQTPQFLNKEILPDPAVTQLLAQDFDQVRVIKEEPVGARAMDRLTRDYYEESALGNLISDLMKAFTFDLSLYPELSVIIGGKALPADQLLGMTNNGGVRANLEPALLNYGHIYNVLPFDNRMALIEVNGAQLLEMITLGISRKHGGFSWSGLTFTAANCVVSSVTVNGKPLDPQETYWVATNDYLAGGGSGFSQLKIDPNKVFILDDAPVIRDAVVAVFRKREHDTARLVEIQSRNYFSSNNRRQEVTQICQNPPSSTK